MKASKIILIIQTIVMYIAQLPITLGLLLFCFINISPEVGKLIIPLFTAGLIASLVILPICFIGFIFALISLGKCEYNPCKVTMIVKLSLIPWYTINFIFSLLVMIGMMNPWLFLAYPIVAIISIAFTYIYMISTSVYDLAYYFHNVASKKVEVKASNVFATIFLFIFLLDIVGSIMYMFTVKEKDQFN